MVDPLALPEETLMRSGNVNPYPDDQEVVQ